MRPYIICHMLSSADGRIDGESLRRLAPAGEYEATGAVLDGDAWICGRTVDELSLLIGPGIDGRHGIATVFDGVSFPSRLKSVERRVGDTLWVRYETRSIGATG